MKHTATTKILLIIIKCSILFGASIAAADSFVGRIVGVHCAQKGKLCPYNGLEKHLATESDFVLQTKTNEYYLLSNIPRDVLVRTALKQAIVEGELHGPSSTISVKALQVQRDEDLFRYSIIWHVDQ